MEQIYRKEEILTLTNGSYIIHDASITKIDIYTQEHKLYIDVYLTSIAFEKRVQTKFRLRFIDVVEYSFYWNAEVNFYTVESYKFFKSNKGYYLSLHPVNSLKEISDDDQDIILSEEIEGSFI